MKRALRGPHRTIAAHEVDYVNAHATSTPVGEPLSSFSVLCFVLLQKPTSFFVCVFREGDDAELKAISTVFAEKKGGIAVSSIKGSVGHLLGAAGAVEAIATILTIRDSMVPPTINLVNPIKTEGSVVDHVANTARRQLVKVALTNSFGFGGTNASLVFSKMQ